MDLDPQLDGLRRRDAFVLAALEHTPETPRAPGRERRHAFVVRSLGIRRSMKRLERRGYLERGWSVDSMGAHFEMTELGKRVAGAAAIVVLAEEEHGWVRAWFGRFRG